MGTLRQLRNLWILWVTTVVLACFSDAVAQVSYTGTDLGDLNDGRLHIGNSGISNPTGLRIEGPSKAGTGAFAESVGGYGDFNIDAVGVIGGRFSVKENGDVTIGNTAASHILSIQQGLGWVFR